MKEIKHGFLGKWKTYKKVGFKEVPPTTEERKQELLNKMKPWEYDPQKIKVKYGFVGGEGAAPEPTYSVSIDPTSVEEFSNVILSATTDLTSPTFVWSLTDFKDTSGNYVSSYTGQVLTEGYFVSSGSSNVSVIATGDEGSATGSTFSVTGIEYILDTFTGASFAYEGRKLSSSSTYAYRVRRSSDNTEQDIGFVGNDLDTASLLSFVGTSGTDNGYVVKFYDQSGNGKDLTQVSASNQPIIVQAGALVENNGLVGAYYDGVNDYINYSGSLGWTGKDIDIFYVGRKEYQALPGEGAIFAGNDYEIDIRNNTTAQFENGGPNYTGNYDHYIQMSGITTGYYRREEFNNLLYFAGDVVVPLPTSAWNTATITDLTDISWIGIGRRQDGALALLGWSYGAIGYNQRSSVNLIDALQSNQTHYYNRPSISGDTTPTQYENVEYQVVNGLYYSAATYTWTMPSGWVGDTTGQTITGYFTETTGGNISVVNESALVSLDATTSVSITSFDPNNISGLEIWVDFNDDTTISTRTDGGNEYISQINNKATGSYISNLSQSTAAYQPLYTSGGTEFNSGLKYASWNSGMVDGDLYSDVNYTGQTHDWFGMVYLTDVGTDGYGKVISVGQVLTPQWNLAGDNFRPRVGMYNTSPSANYRSVYNYTLTGITYFNIPNDISASIDGKYIPYDTIYINDTTLGPLDIAVSYGTTATANAYQDNRPFRIGNDTGDAYVSNGYYGEIFSFSRILTTSEKSQIKNYLQSKWV